MVTPALIRRILGGGITYYRYTHTSLEEISGMVCVQKVSTLNIPIDGVTYWMRITFGDMVLPGGPTTSEGK